MTLRLSGQAHINKYHSEPQGRPAVHNYNNTNIRSEVAAVSFSSSLHSFASTSQKEGPYVVIFLLICIPDEILFFSVCARKQCYTTRLL